MRRKERIPREYRLVILLGFVFVTYIYHEWSAIVLVLCRYIFPFQKSSVLLILFRFAYLIVSIINRLAFSQGKTLASVLPRHTRDLPALVFCLRHIHCNTSQCDLHLIFAKLKFFFNIFGSEQKYVFIVWNLCTVDAFYYSQILSARLPYSFGSCSPFVHACNLSET